MFVFEDIVRDKNSYENFMYRILRILYIRLITLYQGTTVLHFFVLENAEFDSVFEFVEKVAIVLKVFERHFPPITSVVATFFQLFPILQSALNFELYSMAQKVLPYSTQDIRTVFSQITVYQPKGPKMRLQILG